MITLEYEKGVRGRGVRVGSKLARSRSHDGKTGIAVQEV
jgi:hypothetical protein